jgi:archaellum component FlaC
MHFELNTAADIAVIASVIAAFVSSAYALWKKIEKHQTNEDVEYAVMKEKLETINKQFGPNGGGLREAVNNIADKIDKIEERVYDISEEVAKLSGEFHQHIVENPKDSFLR